MTAAGAVSVGLVLVWVWHLAWFRRLLDFSVYVMGAHHLTDGRLYVAGLPYAPYLPFTYPPFAALAFVPFDVVPGRWAQLLWELGNVAVLFVFIALSLRAVRPGLDRSRLLLWSAALVAPAFFLQPVWLTFGYGQVNIVLATMVLADLTLDLRVGRRTLPRGVLVGIAAAVKLTPLVFVPYLFLTRQTRAAWVSLGTFVVCSSVAAAVDPRVSWSYWTKYAVDAQRVGAGYYISNQSLFAVADRLDHRVVATSVVAVVGVVTAAAGLVLARWAWKRSSPILGVLVCATTGLLVSPITWAHHMVWVVPVLLWLVWAADRPAGGRIWAAAGAALFWWAPIWSVPYGNNRELAEHGWQLLAGNAFFVAMVVFMAGIAGMLALRARAARSARASPPADRPVTGRRGGSRTTAR